MFQDNDSLKIVVLKTLAFFDLFDFPLTSFEIWQHLPKRCSLLNVEKTLQSLVVDKKISHLFGCYFISGRDSIVDTRLRRFNYTDRKMKRALWVTRVFKFIPWIKMVAVGNIIGSNNLRDGSDIDLFVVTQKGRVWLTRLCCVVLMKILRLRPQPGKEKDKICLSFYVSEAALEFEELMLSKNDVYFIYWLVGLVPIYDTENVYDNFIQKNKWIQECLPNWQKTEMSARRNAGKPFSIIYRDMVDIFIGGLEGFARKIQNKKMSPEIKKEMNKNTNVVVGAEILKLHVNDRRDYYRQKYQEKKWEILEK